MKHCEAIAIELTPAGAIFQGPTWPEEIAVDRGLFDYPQGPHIQFGRRGSLQFTARNGFAAYRRVGDIAGGWRYVRTDHKLEGAAPAVTGNAAIKSCEPAAAVAAQRYRLRTTQTQVEAFQWLPHAVPPLALPDWFLRADFEHNREGLLTIRNRSNIAKAEPSDWIVSDGRTITVVKSAAFADYALAEAVAA